MIDYSELRRRFKAKNPELAAQRAQSRAAARRIAREFAAKRAELRLDRREERRPLAYYLVLVLVMVVLAGVFTAMMTGKVGWGKPANPKDLLQARQSIAALAVALGRYRFHCGDYPSDAAGLAALAAVTPGKPGWFGPYVRKVVPDPWGEPYAYWRRPEGGVPVLLSKGPDRKLGTTDDILPDPRDFDLPFRDTTWTNHWVPYHLRGVVLAPDEATRQRIREEVDRY